MREIVHIQGGQCGNQVGSKFWEVREADGVQGKAFEKGREKRMCRHLGLEGTSRAQERAPRTSAVCMIEWKGKKWDAGAHVTCQ